MTSASQTPPLPPGTKEYARRRQRLLASLEKGDILMLPAAPVRYRNHDVAYPFRQDSNFQYVTGLTEPKALLLLAPQHDEGEFMLFCQQRDPQQEQWTEAVTGAEGAVRDYGASSAWDIEELPQKLPELLQGCRRIFYPMGQYPDFDQQLQQILSSLRANLRAGVELPTVITDARELLHEMRVIKSTEEIKLMRQAAVISSAAMCRAISVCAHGLSERQLEAELLHEYMAHGAAHWAYPPIVAAGANACILHYTANNALLQSGDLVLIDAGCEWHGYAADISRTFPVAKQFSREQQALYEVVLQARAEALATLAVGNPWNAPHDASVKAVTAGLVDLGIISGEIDELIAEGGYLPYYMHRVGHWLGMDVHDAGAYKVNGQWRPFQAGMVTTIEPGIYIPQDAKEVAPEWRGIGIRVEDDVLVTDNDYEVFTDDVPRTVQEIEALRH